jgi:hypothetical protein
MTATTAATTTAKRVTMSHADHDHPATSAARKACRDAIKAQAEQATAKKPAAKKAAPKKAATTQAA